MKHLLLTFLLALSGHTYAQFEIIPDSPLDTSMGDAAGNTIGTLNQIEREEEQEEEPQEELLENRYDVPSEEEEEEFNQNGPNEP